MFLSLHGNSPVVASAKLLSDTIFLKIPIENTYFSLVDEILHYLFLLLTVNKLWHTETITILKISSLLTFIWKFGFYFLSLQRINQI